MDLPVPFPPRRQPAGTAWIMTDRHDRHVDAGDERMLRLLADFAGAWWVQWQNWEAAIAENRRRDEIFTTLIHELRSPLAAIAAAASVIERTAGLAAVASEGVIGRCGPPAGGGRRRGRPCARHRRNTP